MADDPTTTGAERDPTTTRARAERLAVLGGVVTPSPVLSRIVRLELDGRFEVAIYGGYVWVAFFAGGDEPLHVTPVRLDLFESEDEARAWALETAEIFAQNWRDVMAFETARHFNNIGRFHLFEMGRGSLSSIEKVIAAQVKELEKNMREWFHLPVGRGRFSKWQGHELAASLITLLARHPAYGWDELAAALKVLDPGRAPKSGDALRQLARRHGLLLRALKRDAAKRRAPEDAKSGKGKAAKRRVKT